MSNYTKSTNFAAKDSLPSGNANKVVKGTEINTEFDNIATAIATKADLNSPTLVTPNLGTPSAAVLTNATGLPLTTGVTGTLPVANGGTGATTFSAGALLKGAGTSAITTATAGTDYAPATSGTSILKGNGSGGFSNAASGTDYAPATSGTAILKGNGTGGFSNAAAGTDYAPATSGTAILKGNGTGGFSNAAAGTDYAAATTGTSAQLLANNGSGGFSNVTVGSGLSLSAGTLSTSGGASISAGDSNVTVSDTGSNGTVTVQTDGSERMRILSGGNVCINSTTDVLGQGARLHITGNSAQTACSIKIGSDGVPGWYFANSAGTKVGDIVINTSSTSYNTSSDYRLKENVQSMTNALATVAQLNPVTYTWKSTGEAGQGFIAHELQAVVPDAVTGEKDAIKTERVEVSPAVPATYDEEGNELTPAVEAVFEDREVPVYQGVDTSFLVATLTAAIQELKAIVDAQAARISALEGN